LQRTIKLSELIIALAGSLENCDGDMMGNCLSVVLVKKIGLKI